MLSYGKHQAISSVPPHTKTCLYLTKLFMKSPTSSATTETTGKNSAPKQPTQQVKPRELLTCLQNHRSTRLLKTKDSLPNRYYKKIHTTSYSSPSTITTSGGCTRRLKLPSEQQKRLTFQQTSRTGSDCPTLNVTSSLMSLHSLLPLMESSMKI